MPHAVARVGEADRLVGDQPDAERGHERERDEGVELDPERDQGQQCRADDEALPVQRADIAKPEEDVREQVERDPAAEGRRQARA